MSLSIKCVKKIGKNSKCDKFKTRQVNRIKSNTYPNMSDCKNVKNVENIWPFTEEHFPKFHKSFNNNENVNEMKENCWFNKMYRRKERSILTNFDKKINLNNKSVNNNCTCENNLSNNQKFDFPLYQYNNQNKNDITCELIRTIDLNQLYLMTYSKTTGNGDTICATSNYNNINKLNNMKNCNKYKKNGRLRKIIS